jgi:hypothetical protein
MLNFSFTAAALTLSPRLTGDLTDGLGRTSCQVMTLRAAYRPSAPLHRVWRRLTSTDVPITHDNTSELAVGASLNVDKVREDTGDVKTASRFGHRFDINSTRIARF